LSVLFLFKGLRGGKNIFAKLWVFPNFLRPLRLLRDRRHNCSETKTASKEAKTKGKRFAGEIGRFAKRLILLGPEIAGFRGFERYQGVERFAKRFFEFCGGNVSG
jgi:hypothetical protein